MKCLYIYCVQLQLLRFFKRPFRFRQSTTNQYQSILIYLSIGIDHNRCQSITTRIFAIDWSSIININRLIDIGIDWYWLSSIIESIDWIPREECTTTLRFEQDMIRSPCGHRHLLKSLLITVMTFCDLK